MSADLVTIATTAVLTQFLTPAAKNLGEVALERAKQIGSKAVSYLAAVGREPQPVEEKILYPLLQAASLEADPSLADLWAVLLANAADTATEKRVTPAYTEILKQLTVSEAKLLNRLFTEATRVFSPSFDEEPHAHFKEPAMRKAWVLDTAIDVSHIRYKMKRGRRNTYDAQELGEQQKFQTMVDNLLRQRLIVSAKDEPIKAGKSFEPKPGEVSKAFMTSLGYDFMLAVTPPAP